jgi:hypothetical protein
MILLYNTSSSLPKKNLFVHNKKTGFFFQSPSFEEYLPTNTYTDFLLSFESNKVLDDFIEETPFKELFFKKVFFKEKDILLKTLRKQKPSFLGWSFIPGSILDIIFEHNLDIYLPALLNFQEWHDFSVQDLRKEKQRPKAYLLKQPLDFTEWITLHDDNPFLIKGNPKIHSYHYTESIEASFLFTEFEKIETFPLLSTLGPSRSLSFYKEYVLEKILLAKELYAYEENFFKTFNISYEEKSPEKKLYPIKKTPYTEILSPSKIQTYRECPKKFKAIYIKKVSRHFSSFHSIGLYLHQYLKEFFFKRDKRIFQELEENLQETLLEYLVPMCHFLDQFEGDFIFEKSFENDHLSFRCDLLILGNTNYLFDFKYSTIPTLKSILHYENIQLTSYLTHLPFDISTYGYLNFKNIEKSLIFSKEKQLFKTQPIPTDFLKNYQENLYIQELLNDKEFLANPQNSHSCLYCPLNNLCLDSKV